jgi:hypothetical protein
MPPRPGFWKHGCTPTSYLPLKGVSCLVIPVALQCAALHVPDPASERDAWIAATAIVHDLAVVTRSVANFQHSKVRIINPWEPTPQTGRRP